ncbi:protein kinase [Streptomyces sp. NPDC008150]|uniref:serine/threonine-protein kinase n=1 Tax=Streptomyces sp. NPDC008150 TaxID=3364816 RepID=UPI0036E49C0A
MGRVWRAVDEILDRPVAVKEMRIGGVDAEDSRTRRERTLREARATARIDHPNVVRVYDVVDEGEHLWIVMELVAGRSLEQIVAEDGPIGPAEAARVGLGLVDALREVHAGGVLHRDIKPGNVLVETVRRRVVLTDFGIAAIQDTKALTMVGMLVGSPDYMAPERISGRHQGPPSDVWSLGATLCAALDGRSPFSRATTLATLHAVLYEEPRLPPSAGPLTRILGALLEKEPEVRPGLAEVAEALRPVAYPSPTPTLPAAGGMQPAEGPPGWGTAVPPGRATTPGSTSAPGPGPGPGPTPTATPGPAADPAPTPAARATPGPVPDQAPALAPTPSPEAGLDPSPGEPEVAEPTPAPAEPAREPEAEGSPGPGSGLGPGLEPEPAPDLDPDAEPDPGSGPRPAPSGSAGEALRGAASGRLAEEAALPRPADAAGPSPAGVPAEAPAGERPPTGERSVASPRPRPTGAPDGTPPEARKPERPPTADAPDTPDVPGAPGEPGVPGEPSDAVPTGTQVLGRGGPPPPVPDAAATPVSLVRPADPRTAAPPAVPRSARPSRSPDSAPASGGSARPGVSLNRAHAPTEVQPTPGPGGGAAPHPAPHPAPDAGVVTPSGVPPTPPGELPGPAVPAGRPRRARRAGLLAGAAVAVAGAVVAAVLLADGGTGGGGDDATAAGGAASASVSGSASSGPPSSGATSSPSPSASSTVAGTARPESLPPGAHREAGGYAWAPPAGWRRDVKTGAEVHYTSPDGRQELVAKSALARGDLFESWQTSEQNAHQGTDYRKIRLERTTFRGYPAVVWEYTFTLQGVPWHARLLGFDARGTSFQVNTWYQPAVADQAVRTYHRVRDGFTVL